MGKVVISFVGSDPIVGVDLATGGYDTAMRLVAAPQDPQREAAQCKGQATVTPCGVDTGPEEPSRAQQSPSTPHVAMDCTVRTVRGARAAPLKSWTPHGGWWSEEKLPPAVESSQDPANLFSSTVTTLNPHHHHLRHTQPQHTVSTLQHQRHYRTFSASYLCPTW